MRAQTAAAAPRWLDAVWIWLPAVTALELNGSALIEVLHAAGKAAVRSELLGPVEPGRSYSVVASELLVDRLAGMRELAGASLPAGSEVEARTSHLARRFPERSQPARSASAR